jgi:hypothetical protein
VPYGQLVLDAAGNLYGTTYVGGNLNYCNGLGCGTVFKMSPTSDGEWEETVLHSFTGGQDGGNPYAGLVSDGKGNFYGTTLRGGDVTGNCGALGCGVVFKLAPTSTGGWKETLLHTFTGADGEYPYSDLIFDPAGNLYGTASEGGYAYGTVFRL